MTLRCCRPYGYQRAEQGLLLERLAGAGAVLPEDARVWGPGDGWAWRIVDKTGRPVGYHSRQSVGTIMAAAGIAISEAGEVREAAPAGRQGMLTG